MKDLYKLLHNRYFKNDDISSEYYKTIINKLKRICEITLNYYPTKSFVELVEMVDTLLRDIEFSLENYVYFISIDDSIQFIMWLTDCKRVIINDNSYNKSYDDYTTVIDFSTNRLLIFVNKIKLKFPNYIGSNYNKFDNIVTNNKLVLELLNYFIINYSEFDGNFTIKNEFEIFNDKNNINGETYYECKYIHNILTNQNYRLCYIV